MRPAARGWFQDGRDRTAPVWGFGCRPSGTATTSTAGPLCGAESNDRGGRKGFGAGAPCPARLFNGPVAVS